MRRNASALALVLTLVAPAAYAADMALKAPPAPMVVDPWAGWYAGREYRREFWQSQRHDILSALPGAVRSLPSS